MNINIFDESDRGQVGIGTLIVFIAMVLVAAIAAGVLINTAGFLQDRSEETGKQSSAQVTDRMQVVSVYGTDVKTYSNDNPDPSTAGDDTKKYDDSDEAWTGVENIHFIVKKAPGAGEIRIDKVTLNFLGQDGAEQIELAAEASAIDNIDGAGDNVLGDSSDRARITIDLNPEVDNGEFVPGNFKPIEPGSEATFEFTTESGATVTKTVTVPPTATTSDETVQL